MHEDAWQMPTPHGIQVLPKEKTANGPEAYPTPTNNRSMIWLSGFKRRAEQEMIWMFWPPAQVGLA